jgi:hypothetical protein
VGSRTPYSESFRSSRAEMGCDYSRPPCGELRQSNLQRIELLGTLHAVSLSSFIKISGLVDSVCKSYIDCTSRLYGKRFWI